MAIITVSRQIASLGDEISEKIAEKLGYTFIGKKELEKRIVSLGFPESKLSKFDEKKLGFFAGLTRRRDEYLNYLMTAILEVAAENNCVIVGRGSFIILKALENHVSCRFISEENLRIERFQNSQNCSRKAAAKKISESDSQQKGFHKEFFNFNVEDSALFDITMNTALLDIDSIATGIVALVKTFVTPEKDAEAQRKVEELLIGQRIVDILVFIYDLNITFLRASVEGKKITLHGMADSVTTIDSAITIVSAELPNYQIESAISIAQDLSF